jgi:hypothetical protein
MRFPAYTALAFTLLTTACGGNSETVTAPTSPTASDVTERFDGTLLPGSSAFFAFTVAQNGGPVFINLASLAPVTQPGVLSVAMEIGYGIPSGETCNVEKTIQAVPGLASQLTDTLAIGTYCANIADIGNLPMPANFSIRITHP